MISEETITMIAKTFCGDIENLYSYKSGPMLIKFMNTNFGFNDTYKQGFPTRWVYAVQCLTEITRTGKLEHFFEIIFSPDYIEQDLKITHLEAIDSIENRIDYFNKIFKQDKYFFVRKPNGRVSIVSIDDDLEYVGGGGFAKVYYSKSKKVIIKKLKEDFITDKGIRSRFKREYNITKSLSDLKGVITVYDFIEQECTYTMERAECTLYDYIVKNTLNDEVKIKLIRMILYIIKEVHSRGIIHRDISPNNIFVINGYIKIADFGLGKDLNVFSSHQTLYTNSVGQYYYCAPEQFMLLRDGNEVSDIYSLGRIINFVMTKDPINYSHMFRSVSDKATSENPSNRYSDVQGILNNITKLIEIREKGINEIATMKKIEDGRLDDSVAEYIYQLDSIKLCGLVETNIKFIDVILKYMEISNANAENIMSLIEDTYQDTCSMSFASYDNFATLSYKVLKSSVTFVLKEKAANILRYIAWSINRFSAQHLVKDVINDCEPLIQDIIRE